MSNQYRYNCLIIISLMCTCPKLIPVFKLSNNSLEVCKMIKYLDRHITDITYCTPLQTIQHAGVTSCQQ